MMRFLINSTSLLLMGILSACSPGGHEGGNEESKTQPADPSIGTYQAELLELAFSGVSEMPLKPHIKNRSRAQLTVVDACLQLGQSRLAAGYIEQIENWQRWMGYANLAAYHAENGDHEKSKAILDKVEPALKMAEDIRIGKIVASTPNPLVDTLMDWRLEAVLTRVEEVRLMNRSIEAFDADEMVYGEVNAARLNVGMVADGEDSAAQMMAALRPFTEHHNFEVVYHGLMELGEVASAHYAEFDLPQLIADEVEPRLEKVPVFLRINVYRKFAEAAVQNNDLPSAQPLIEEIGKMVEGLKPKPAHYIPEAVKVIRLHNQAGQIDEAAKQLDGLLEFYDEKRDFIVNIERADLLCHMAELYHEFGDTSKALELYRRAVAEGRVNPNSRPQADDLNRICCSMALLEVKPDAALWEQLKGMCESLGDPW